MNRMRNRNLLAMALCLLMCMTAVVAHADEGLEAQPAPVIVVSETLVVSPDADEGVRTSAPAQATTEGASSGDTREPDAPKDGQDTTEPTTYENTPAGDAPSSPVETQNQNADVGQGTTHTPSSPEAPAGELQGEGNDQIPDDAQGETGASTQDDESEDGEPTEVQEVEDEVSEEEPDQPTDDESDNLEETEPEQTDEDTELTETEPELIEEDLEQVEEVVEEEAEAVEIHPVIRLEGYVDGDVITEGTQVTIRADISGIPADVTYDMQWQNNRSGEFQDVQGETDTRVTFSATEDNVKWAWRMVLTLHAADSAS